MMLKTVKPTSISPRNARPFTSKFSSKTPNLRHLKHAETR